MTEEMELICFQVISSAGGAKSNYISAIQAAKEGRFDDVEAAIKVIPQLLGPHDLVLAKGSRSVGLDRLVQEVR